MIQIRYYHCESCKKHEIGQVHHTKNMDILLVYELTSVCEFQ